MLPVAALVQQERKKNHTEPLLCKRQKLEVLLACNGTVQCIQT